VSSKIALFKIIDFKIFGCIIRNLKCCVDDFIDVLLKEIFDKNIKSKLVLGDILS
jgi:hypothetical protein